MTYVRFVIILTRFYIIFSRQEHQIDVLNTGIVQRLRFSGFILYPLSFFLFSPALIIIEFNILDHYHFYFNLMRQLC